MIMVSIEFCTASVARLSRKIVNTGLFCPRSTSRTIQSKEENPAPLQERGRSLYTLSAQWEEKPTHERYFRGIPPNDGTGGTGVLANPSSPTFLSWSCSASNERPGIVIAWRAMGRRGRSAKINVMFFYISDPVGFQSVFSTLNCSWR